MGNVHPFSIAMLDYQRVYLHLFYSWLVVWNMNFIFHNIWDNPPNWLSYFSRWLELPSRSYPCWSRQNAPRKNVEWDTRSQHLALTIDGIRWANAWEITMKNGVFFWAGKIHALEKTPKRKFWMGKSTRNKSLYGKIIYNCGYDSPRGPQIRFRF